MSLEEKLAEIRAGAAKRIPPQALATMHSATNALRASGILDRVIRPGTPLPAFALAGATGVERRADDLLARGGIVLSVFRGHW